MMATMNMLPPPNRISRQFLAYLAALWIVSDIYGNVTAFSIQTSRRNRGSAMQIIKSQSLLHHRRRLLITPLYSTPTNNNDDDKDSRKNNNDKTQQQQPSPIDVSVDARLTRVRLSRAMGIDWGTDLSFSFVYVRAMDPNGDAYMSKRVRVGDQLCEMTPVSSQSAVAAPVNLVGAPFDFVMESFATLDKTIQQVDLVFFRGTKDELKALVTGQPVSTTNEDLITVTVIQDKGSPQETTRQLQAPRGTNLRQLLVDNQINVYQSLTRWTNCKGKQLCGTCIVNVTDGSMQTNRKSMDEASTLRENPNSYRLSCVTFCYGNVQVETFPPVQVSQWTR
ncbi:hypothetical protein MPSEU_000828900 [Mayamaea pseudoterrestris]|nr:hypothetical protein MPSEU_000828900 [Mayamaea pseudoterrestris]